MIFFLFQGENRSRISTYGKAALMTGVKENEVQIEGNLESKDGSSQEIFSGNSHWKSK